MSDDIIWYRGSAFLLISPNEYGVSNGLEYLGDEPGCRCCKWWGAVEEYPDPHLCRCRRPENPPPYETLCDWVCGYFEEEEESDEQA